MAQRKLYIAAYDISDDKRLRRALSIARDYATGGQKSVHECFLTDDEWQQLLQRMARVIDPEEDRFLLVRISQNAHTRTLGLGEAPSQPGYWYFDQ